jgi:hypothetical protein
VATWTRVRVKMHSRVWRWAEKMLEWPSIPWMDSYRCSCCGHGCSYAYLKRNGKRAVTFPRPMIAASSSGLA